MGRGAVVFGVLAFAGAAAVGFGLRLPLSVLAPDAVAEAAARGVTLDPQSTLAQGSAAAGVGNSAKTAIDWRLAGVSLRPLGVRVPLRFQGLADGQSEAVIGAFGALVRDAVVTVDAVDLGLLPVLAPAGLVRLRLDQASIDRAGQLAPGLAAQLAWQGAQVTLDKPIALGDISGAVVSARATRLRWDVTNQGGDVGIGGTIALDLAQGRRVDIDVLITPRAGGFDPAFAALLAQWGVQEAGGYRIRRSVRG
ncbi:MAG: type II secretion system protein N [Pseudomonadota bacterium]